MGWYILLRIIGHGALLLREVINIPSPDRFEGFPKLGYLLGGPNYVGHSFLGSTLGFPHLWKLPFQVWGQRMIRQVQGIGLGQAEGKLHGV